VTQMTEIFRRAMTGEITVDAAAAQIAVLQAATGAPVSAHDVAAARESDGVVRTSAAASSGLEGPAPAAYNPASGVDPTPEQLAGFSAKMLVMLDEMRPGAVERVDQAARWESLGEADQAETVASREAAEYEQRMATDRAFYDSEMQRHVRESLDARWWNLSPEDRMMEAATAGISEADFAKLAAAKDARAASDVAEARSLGGPA
jgi:hypothetical protein